MLPHILHTTGRAVAVVQNQTHTIRNVLQLQSSGPSSGSGSSWGNGPGPGGSKYGAGSRFYAGHNVRVNEEDSPSIKLIFLQQNAGRAVTQANAVTSHDGQISQSDDIEEITPKWTILPTPQRKRRMRSSSVSMGVAGRNERAEKLGVLKTVQLHARGKHAFAPSETMASAKERLLAEPTPAAPPPTQPLLVRRNSTSAPLSPLLNATEPPPPPSQAAEPKQAPPTDEKSVPQGIQDEIEHFRSMSRHSNQAGVAKSVRRMLATYQSPPVELFNAALNASVHSRQPGTSLTQIIELYNAMLSKSVLPDVETYELLIQALTQRDVEVHRAQIALDLRVKHKSQVSYTAEENIDKDVERLRDLKKEDNFASAMSLFEGILAGHGKDHVQMQTFVRLMSCAANRGDVHSAIHVFAQLEARSDLNISAPVYRYLILTFSNAGQVDQAEEIFKSFLTAGAQNKLHRYPAHLMGLARQSQIQVWNTMMEAYFRAGMPDKAIELVDQVLKSDAGNNFTMADVPVVTSSMFTTVINGFLTSGDITSALTWFDKLLPQEKAPEDPYQGLAGRVMRPDGLAWFMMIDHLADNNKLDDLNRLFRTLKEIHITDGLRINPTLRLIVYTANLEYLRNNKETADPVAAVENVKYLLEDLRQCTEWDIPRGKLAMSMCHELAIRGEFLISTATYVHLTTSGMSFGDVENHAEGWRMRAQQSTTQFIRDVYMAVNDGLGTLSIESAIPLARTADQIGMKPVLPLAPALLHAYGAMVNGDDVVWNISMDDWRLLFSYALPFEINAANGNPNGLVDIPGFAYPGIFKLVDHFNAEKGTFDALGEGIQQELISVITARTTPETRQDVLVRLGPKYVEAAEKYDELRFAALENNIVQDASILNPVESQVLDTDVPALRYNPYVTQDITTALGPPTGMISPEALEKAYQLFARAVQQSAVPSSAALCRLIEGEGRAKDLDKVRELYTAAQALLRVTPPETQRFEWAAIENSMVIALAHAGHVDAAHVHRARILEQGLAPSADAYGILVQLVRDTTDDTSGAVALFEEALARGVAPNMYLYNNIISKLSKARKADYALELFEQMKAAGMKLSSITYGAVIGACARVGDVVAAENLFKEMTRSRNFKPRVPPYNTMMQLFTQTKPSRASALYYYQEMRKAGVRPSAHTYKVRLSFLASLTQCVNVLS